jgi:alkanesulfonate monooxygenase SsuD/methylene tetrahydromethanopterin reductase-like flavin-dependent oxidoreductase (luciferase family)
MKEHRPMPTALPALNLIAEPGRRRATLDTAREIERRGFAGISVSSSFGNMSQSVGLALATERIPFATAIAPIYAQSVDEFAQNAAYLHEVSGGRFQFGIGIAHAPAYVRMEVKPGKPLGDIRAFVEKFKSHTEYGPLPPVILATLRKRMIALSAEIADGLVFANASRAHMTESLMLCRRRSVVTRISLSATAFAPASPTTSTRQRRCCARRWRIIGRCRTTETTGRKPAISTK